MSKFSKQIKKELKNEKHLNKNSQETKSKNVKDLKSKFKNSEKDFKENKSKYPRIKKFIIVFFAIILSIIVGLVVCFFINKKEITQDVILSNYSNTIKEEKRIIAVSNLKIDGKMEGKEYSQNFTVESRINDDLYYNKQSEEALFYGYDFSEMYVTKDWLYVKKKDGDWNKFKFADFFGKNATIYDLFDMYFSVSIAGETDVTEDKSHYYIKQDLNLEQFLQFIGQDEKAVSAIVKKFSEANGEEAKKNYKVKNVYTFSKKSYDLQSTEFSFYEPLKSDDDNYLDINLKIEYSTGTSADFVVPNSIANNAVELDANKVFERDKIKNNSDNSSSSNNDSSSNNNSSSSSSNELNSNSDSSSNSNSNSSSNSNSNNSSSSTNSESSQPKDSR